MKLTVYFDAALLATHPKHRSTETVQTVDGARFNLRSSPQGKRTLAAHKRSEERIKLLEQQMGWDAL